MRKHLHLAILNRLARLAGCAIIFFVGATATSSAEDISIESAKAGLAAKQCPAAEVERIDANDRCDPNGREHRACDQRFPAASAGWQNCYYGIEQCRKQAAEDNDVIYKSNEVFRQCHRNDAASSKTLPMGGKGVPASDLASRLAAQQAKNATADDVRRQQDQQFSDIVRAQQQQYQQRKAAREQAEQAALEREREAKRKKVEQEDPPASETDAPAEGATKSYCGPGRYLAAGGFYCCPYSERGRPPC